jgi:hypothetical protein
MVQPIESMDELIGYLGKVEQRLADLETENSKLRTLTLDNSRQDRKEFARYVAGVLPQTAIVSPNFFKRAFAVWGHFFVAHLILSLTIGLCVTVLMMTLFGATFNSLLQNVKR